MQLLKKFAVVFITLSMVMGMNMTGSWAVENDRELTAKVGDEFKYISEFKGTLTQDGKTFDFNNPNDMALEYKAFTLELSWIFRENADFEKYKEENDSDSPVNVGDSFTYELPEIFNLKKDTVYLKNIAGKDIGTVTPDGNKITVTYDGGSDTSQTNLKQYINGAGRNSKVRIEGEFKKNANGIENGGNENIDMNGFGSITFNIERDATLDEVDVEINKPSLNKNDSIESTYIYDVTTHALAKGYNNNTNLVIDLNNKLSLFDPTTIKVYKDKERKEELKNDAGSSLVPTYDATNHTATFTLGNFKDEDTHDFYIDYQVSISAKNALFTNNAEKLGITETITSTQKPTGKTAETDITIDHTWVAKNGEYQDNGQIQWNVTLNNGDVVVDLNGYNMRDTLDITKNELATFEVSTSDSKNGTFTKDEALTKALKESLFTDKGYTVTSSLKKIVKITYASNAKKTNEVIENNLVNKDGNHYVPNEFYLTPPSGEGYGDIAKVESDAMYTYLTIKNTNEDIKANTLDNITWDAKVRIPEWGIDSAKVKFNLPKDMTITSITNDGKEVDFTDNTVDLSDLKFDADKQYVELKLTTQINSIPKFDHYKYTLVGVLSSKGNEVADANDTYTYIPYLTKEAGEAGSGEYAGYIMWKFHLRDLPNNDLKITDTLPDGLSILNKNGLDTSLADVKVVGKTATFKLTDDGYEQAKTSKGLDLEFYTRVDEYDAKNDRDFTNKAQLTLDDNSYQALESTFTGYRSHPIVSKTIDYTEKTAPNANYTIKINEDRFKIFDGLTQVTLTDTMGKNLDMNISSLKISKDGKDVTKDMKYSLTYSDNGNILTIEGFDDETFYEITYECTVNTKPGEKVNAGNNTVTLTTSSEYKEDSSTTTPVSSATDAVALEAAGSANAEAFIINITEYKDGDEIKPNGGTQYSFSEVTVNNGEVVSTTPLKDMSGSTTVSTGTTDSEKGNGSFILPDNGTKTRIIKVVESSIDSDTALNTTPSYIIINPKDDDYSFVDESGNKVTPKVVETTQNSVTIPRNVETAHDITINHLDPQNKKVTGTTVRIVNEDGYDQEVFKTTVSSHVSRLSEGNYKLYVDDHSSNYTDASYNKETINSKTPLEFTVDKNGKVTYKEETLEDNKIDLYSEFVDHIVNFKYVDKRSESIIKEGNMELSGTPFDSTKTFEKTTWRSSDEGKTLTLQPGTYKLHEEENAVTGYVLNGDVEFTLNVDGTLTQVTESSNFTTGTSVIDVKENPTATLSKAGYKNYKVKVNINKEDGTALKKEEYTHFSEAQDKITLTIKDLTVGKKNEVVEATATDTDGDGVIDLELPFGDYEITQTSTHYGYDSSKTTAKLHIDPNGTMSDKSEGTSIVTIDEDNDATITYTDSLHKFDILTGVLDEHGDQVDGNKLRIVDKDGNQVVDSWETATTPHTASLTYGDYTLEYVGADDQEGFTSTHPFKKDFTVDRKGHVVTKNDTNGNTVNLEYAYIKYNYVVHTYDEYGNKLSDVTYVVNKNGASYDKNSSKSITTKDGEVADKLEFGNYKLHNTSVPSGYERGEDVEMTIERNGNTTVTNTPNVTSTTETEDGVTITHISVILKHKYFDKSFDLKDNVDKKAIHSSDATFTLEAVTKDNTGAHFEDGKQTKTFNTVEEVERYKLSMGEYKLTQNTTTVDFDSTKLPVTTFKVEGDGSVVNIKTDNSDTATYNNNTLTSYNAYRYYNVDFRVNNKRGDYLSDNDLELTSSTLIKDGLNTLKFKSDDKNTTYKLHAGHYKVEQKILSKGYNYDGYNTVEFDVVSTEDGYALETNDGTKVNSDDHLITFINDYKKYTVNLDYKNDLGKAIKGSDFTITRLKDSNEESDTSISFTSTGSMSSLKTNLLYDHTYTISQNKTLPGYESFEPITFHLDDQGQLIIDSNKTDSVVDGKNNLTLISKLKRYDVDLEVKNEFKEDINDASLTLTSNNGLETITFDSSSKKVQLPMGTYTYKMSQTPDSYKENKELQFTVNPDGSIKDYDTNTVVLTPDYRHYSKRIKVLVDGKELSGAHFSLVNDDANHNHYNKSDITSTSNKLDLIPGTYTLTQLSTPNGYDMNEDKVSKLTIGNDGTTSLTNGSYEGEDLIVENSKHHYTVHFNALNEFNEEVGGTYKVTDGTNVYGSDDAKKSIELPVGQYTFECVSPEDGYEKGKTIHFTVSANKNAAYLDDKGIVEVTDGKQIGNLKENTIVMPLDYKKFNKNVLVEVDGKELEGATFSLVNDNEKHNAYDLTNFTTTKKDITLIPGTYTLTQLSTPNGYDINEDKVSKLTIGNDGTTSFTNGIYDGDDLIVENTNHYYSVNFNVINDRNEEVGGTYRVTDGTHDYGTASPKQKLKLKQGTYKFECIKPQSGYDKGETITLKLTPNNHSIYDMDDGVVETISGHNLGDDDKNEIIMSLDYSKYKNDFIVVDDQGHTLKDMKFTLHDLNDGKNMTCYKMVEDNITSTLSKQDFSTDLSYGHWYLLKVSKGLEGYTNEISNNYVEDEIYFKLDTAGHIIYTDATGRTMLPTESNTIKITNPLSYRDVELSLTNDYKEAISGVDFEIYKDEHLYKTLTTSTLDSLPHTTLEYGHYTIKQKTHVPGYKQTPTTTFTVEKDGTIHGEHITHNNRIELTIPFSKKDISLDVVDNKRSKRIEDATFTLVRKEGNVDKQMTTTSSLHTESLPYGHYTLTQIGTAKGFQYDKNPITFEITKQGDIRFDALDNKKTSYKDDKITVINDYYDYDLTIKLKNIRNQDIGGTVTLVDCYNNTRLPIISDEGTYSYNDLEKGEYILTQTEVAKGYLLNTKRMKLIVDDRGSMTLDNKKVENKEADVIDEFKKYDINISLKAIRSDECLEKGKFRLYNRSRNASLGNESEVERTWESTKGFVGIKNIALGTYELEEVESPAGYNKARNVIFTLLDDGSIVEGRVNSSRKSRIQKEEAKEKEATIITNHLTVYNDYSLYEVPLTLKDLRGDLVDDAKVVVTPVTDKTNTDTDNETVIEVNKDDVLHLPFGEYTVSQKEEDAPIGYKTMTPKRFIINRDGSLNYETASKKEIEMVEPFNKTEVKLALKDDKNELLNDGSYEVIDEKSGETVFTSSSHTSMIDFPFGDYILKQTRVPLGFLESKVMRFNISKEGTISMLNKVITQDTSITLVDAHKKYETEINLVDTSLNNIPGGKLVVYDEYHNAVEVFDSTDTSHKLDLPFGTYTLTELNPPKGYDGSHDMTFTIERTGTIVMNGESVEHINMINASPVKAAEKIVVAEPIQVIEKAVVEKPKKAIEHIVATSDFTSVSAYLGMLMSSLFGLFILKKKRS